MQRPPFQLAVTSPLTRLTPSSAMPYSKSRGAGVFACLFLAALYCLLSVAPARAYTGSINGTLGSGSPDYAFTSGTQTGRITRDGNPSACGSPKTYPGTIATTGARAFDAYTFTNTSSSSVCVTASYTQLSGPASGLFAVAYLGTFDPANIATNYLSDSGSSPAISIPQAFAFDVPAGASFTLVIHALNPGTATGATYNLTIDPFDDAPVNTVPGAQAINQDVPLTFSAANNNALTVSDADAGNNVEQVTLTAVNGTFVLGSTVGLTSNNSNSSSNTTATFTGPLTALNGALNNLVFLPDSGFSGAASLTILTNDLGNSGLNGPDTATQTVVINVRALARTLSINNVSVTEGNSGVTNAVFTVTLSSSSARPISVQYVTADGTASAGSDYTATSGTLNFASGVTSQTITVPVFGDLLYETDETFTVTLSNPTGPGVSLSASATIGTGTIVNDDAMQTLAINNVSVTEGNTGTTPATFTVTLSNPSALPITVQYATADGTATAGSDYNSTSGTLNFAPGVTSQTITVPVFGDTLYETDETFTVTLSNPTGPGARLRDSATVGTGTIVNDDAAPVLAINNVSVAEGNTGITPATFAVTLSNPSALPVTVQYATADGTATAGSDYAATSGTLTFASGVTSQTITVPVFGDLLYETDETFTMTLSNPTGPGVSLSASATIGTGTILNDDALPPTPVVSIGFSNVATGNIYHSFPTVVGSVSETNALPDTTLAVQVSIQRQSDKKFYNGKSWSATPTLFPAATGNGVWVLASGILPGGANGQAAPDGKYTFTALATDNHGQHASTAVTLTLDHTAPTITLTLPSALARLAQLSVVAGKANDAPGGTGVQQVLVFLVREADGKYFDGKTFVVPTIVKSVVQAPVLKANYDPKTSAWSRRTGLPTAAELQPGSYRLLAIAIDGASNRAQVTSRFTVPLPVTPPVTPQPKSTVLSTSSARVSNSSVTLKFTVVLDADSASDAAHYSVTINGKAMSIESAGYNATTRTVTLGLPEGALQAGDAVVVQWSGLTDSKGVAVAGTTAPVTAR